MGDRDSAQLLLKMLPEHQILWVLLKHSWDLQGNRNRDTKLQREEQTAE